VNWFVKLLTLLFCFRTLLLWLYESDHLRVGYLSRSLNMWFIRILRDAWQPSVLVRLRCGMTLILREMDYRTWTGLIQEGLPQLVPEQGSR